MDLFLINKTQRTAFPVATLGYAALALAGLYLLNRIFKEKGEEDSDDEG